MGVRDTYHHKWKWHLGMLPRVEDFPNWQGTSEFACLLIPVFSFDESVEHIESYVAKAAAWSLKTWKENSDASLFNIPCFIYVEDSISDAAMPILKDYGVPSESIIVSEYGNTERLAKCLQPVFDKRLEKYEYLIISDVDIFAIKGPENVRLPFFENVRSSRPSGFGCKVPISKIPHYWIPHFKNLAKYKNIEIHGDLVDAWFQAMEDLTGRNDLRRYYDGGEGSRRPWTAVMAIHKDTFNESSKQLIEQASRVFGDDEAVTYTWMCSQEESHVWDLDDINIEIFADLVFYINSAYSQTFKKSNIDDVVFEDIYYDQPFLLHHFASHDFKFMDLLGIRG